MKKKYALVVKVPKTPRSAYNPERAISTLIENQLRHLALVEQRLPAAHRTGVDVAALKTEREASAYIQRVTAKLHPEGADVTPLRAKRTIAKKAKARKRR